MTTAYHSKHLAHLLTLRGASDSLERLTRSIADARVDLNPHQVDAALFAFRSPLSRGCILADEVGLGKTIEAGIVMSQRWAERRRRILLLVPAAIRRQWQAEMEEKFYLPVRMLDSEAHGRLRRGGEPDPFDTRDGIVVCSYHFAARRAEEIQRVGWDLVVMDEAHRLRNVYKPQNRMARSIREATSHAPKLMLTATPLQNSLMELYGLVSVIDDRVFGDERSFRERFVRDSGEVSRRMLRSRLGAVCTRTLRSQVQEYIRFTRRVPLTQEFTPTDEEQRLYEGVSEYLSREKLLALPNSQRALITLVLRKLLASSTFAIAGTLRSLVQRLEGQQTSRMDDLLPVEDYEALDELADELETETPNEEAHAPGLLREELALLRGYAELAESIRENAKGEALVPALERALEEAQALGAERKAVIFTESRRTQRYLLELLNRNGYDGRVVTFNGSNDEPRSREIHASWLERHEGEEATSRSAGVRSALIEEFRERAEIMVATESAAEGVNLQFCSLVVNYDLPWNPQRVEQRIGRCHRYGQRHDVVVLNFVNRRNEADRRVFELLDEKFRLFSGVFGASDEVLGALESGVDVERRIARVYEECRTTGEISSAFDELQAELEAEISTRLADTRQILLDNFDEDVHARLKLYGADAPAKLSAREQDLLDLARFELDGDARFFPDEPRFSYHGPDAPHGTYCPDWRLAEQRGDTFLRAEHPLARSLISRAAARELPVRRLRLDYSSHPTVVSALAPLVGRSGWLRVSRLAVESLDLEEFMVYAARADSGEALDADLCRKLLNLKAEEEAAPGAEPPPELGEISEERTREVLREVDERNEAFFDEEVAKLDGWADDLKIGLERELQELDRGLKEVRRESRKAASLQEKLAAQKEIKGIESARTRKRRELYDAQDAIDAERDTLIQKVEAQLGHEHKQETLFTISWTIT